MLNYADLKQISNTEERKRTIAGLKRLREALGVSIPPRNVTDTLLIATWNIRELDSENSACAHWKPIFTSPRF